MRHFFSYSCTALAFLSLAPGCDDATELRNKAAQTVAPDASSVGAGGTEAGSGEATREAGRDSTSSGGRADKSEAGVDGADVSDGSIASDGAPDSGVRGSGGVTATGGMSGTGGVMQPPAPTLVTLTTDSVSLAAGEERYLCQNFANPGDLDAGIVSSESIMPEAGLDIRVFRLPSNMSSGFLSCDGLELTDYVHDAAELDGVFKNPDGVGRFWSKSEGLRVLVHFLNSSTQSVSAKATLKLEVVPATFIQRWASPIFVNMTLSVPPGSSFASRDVQIPFGIEVFRTLGRMYSRGTHVRVTSSSAPLLFDSTQSLNTPATNLSPPASVATLATMTVRCDYDNQTSNTYTYGSSAPDNERCFFSGFFYPTSASDEKKPILR